MSLRSLPLMGVPALPPHPESTPVTSPSAPFVAAYASGAQPTIGKRKQILADNFTV